MLSTGRLTWVAFRQQLSKFKSQTEQLEVLQNSSAALTYHSIPLSAGLGARAGLVNGPAKRAISAVIKLIVGA